MKFKEKRHLIVQETGIVINPCIFWLGASPDGLVYDSNSVEPVDLLEIKCPEQKKNSTPEEAMADEKFYGKLVNGKPVLKSSHHLAVTTKSNFSWNWHNSNGVILLSICFVTLLS